VALGGMLSYTGRDFQSCDYCNGYGYTDKFFGLTGAIMY
jgi:hypothetical protein